MTVPPSPIPAASVSQEPLRSPLRYPGGKTWFVPHARAWLARPQATPPPLLVEAFAGGASVSLAMVMEHRVQRCLLVEADPDVAAFWRAALNQSRDLQQRCMEFHLTPDTLAELAQARPAGDLDRAFRTLLLNRTRPNGNISPNTSSMRRGENDRGIASRWYPGTIRRRLESIRLQAHRIAVTQEDALQVLPTLDPDTPVFLDPPYTQNPQAPGHRLYSQGRDLDHAALFRALRDLNLDFLMTHGESPEVLRLIAQNGFHAVSIAMRTGHHLLKQELAITRDPHFLHHPPPPATQLPLPQQ